MEIGKGAMKLYFDNLFHCYSLRASYSNTSSTYFYELCAILNGVLIQKTFQYKTKYNKGHNIKIP